MYCKYCGKEIANNSESCPHCGRSLKEFGEHSQTSHKENNDQFYKQTWFGIIMLFVFWPIGLYLIFKYSGKFTKILIGGFFGLIFITALGTTFNKIHIFDDSWDKNVAKVMEEKLDQSVPSQKIFNELLTDYKNEYKNAKTDLKRVSVVLNHQRKIDEFLQSGDVKNWVAQVYLVEPTYDKKAAKIALRYNIDGVNYEITTGIIDSYNVKTLIPTNSKLYEKATGLVKGDIVTFSGRFVKDYGENSYFNKYRTDNTSPELKFQFEDINVEVLAPKVI